MKKIGSVTMFLLVVLMVAPVFAADINIYLGQGLNPAATKNTPPTTSIFVDPSAKGLNDVSKPNAVYLGQGLNPAATKDTPPTTSIFVDPSAKGLGDASKPNVVNLGQGLNPAAVTPVRINIFTGAPY